MKTCLVLSHLNQKMLGKTGVYAFSLGMEMLMKQVDVIFVSKSHQDSFQNVASDH
jgi:hypothetical protein